MVVSGDELNNLLSDHPLVKAKLLYFFYEAVAKTLPAHLAAYYKHTLLLSPHQVSVLVAARYFAILFGSPVLGSIADRLNRFRNILIVTLLALLLTYLVVPIIEPIDGFNCLEHMAHVNRTNISLVDLYGASAIYKFAIGRRSPNPLHGHFHGNLMYGFFYSWPFETWAYEETDEITLKVFITLLIVTLIGEFFASPTETFVDVYTLQTLRHDHRDRLGWQLVTGVVGWLLISIVFIALRFGKPSRGDFCNIGVLVASTPYLFVVYGLIIICIVIATTLTYTRYTNATDLPPPTTANDDSSPTMQPCNNIKDTKCFRACTVFIECPAYAAFALAVIFSGFSAGTKTLFIYSYLEDLSHGSLIILAIICVNAASNIIVLLLSPYLLRRFKHENCIAAGLFVNGVTFITYSVINNPWLVMLVEPFDGICMSLSWVAFLTYVGCPPHIGAALQGLLHGLYRGLGIAIGYFVVSVFILRFGYLALFVGLGLIYLFMFGGYVCVVQAWPSPSIAERYSDYTILCCDSNIHKMEEEDEEEEEEEVEGEKGGGADYESARLDTSSFLDNSSNK